MSSDWSIPLVPAELKSLAPYFQRAQELRTKDPVMAYWCTYYAAQQGIPSQNANTRPFLFQVMNVLEEMKMNLADNEALADDVGAAYIESFALRVFNMADNEDRKGQATRSTAKKFLASANFFELLRIFDNPISFDIEEKIRYAKWKAADIAKAFREGRKPIPGDANAPSVPHPLLSETPQESATSMSAWSPGTSLAPSPAVPGVKSLEPSPVSATDIPLPKTVSNEDSPEPVVHVTSSPPERTSLPLLPKDDAPSTPSPRSFGAHLNLSHDGFVTPGMWSTVATPGTEDVYKSNNAMGSIDESPSARAAARRAASPVANSDDVIDADMDSRDDSWSTATQGAMSRQNSWTVVDSTPETTGDVMPLPPPSGIGLGLQPDGTPPFAPVKRVHFSPSVVGGLSSASSSVAGSSPPASPEGYTPSLPPVQEAAYSSDSDHDISRHDPVMDNHVTKRLPESNSSASEGSSHGVPPVVHKVSSPLPPNDLSLPRSMPQVPSQQFPLVPSQAPTTQPNSVGSPPQFPTLPNQQAGGSPAPPAPPVLHATPRFAATSLVHGSHHVLPRSPSPPPELNSTEIARIQKHCRFAISALDYEDAETARKELRAALAMLGE